MRETRVAGRQRLGRILETAQCQIGDLTSLVANGRDVALQLLFEVRRVLKPNGRTVMIDVGASAFWRSFLGAIVLRVLLVRYGLSRRDARARAEVEAFRNVRTATEWKTLLSELGFSRIEVAESRALRPWYPSAMTMSAVL